MNVKFSSNSQLTSASLLIASELVKISAFPARLSAGQSSALGDSEVRDADTSLLLFVIESAMADR
jgi:hypothetical protein